MTFEKPKVTIDLDEYQHLKEQNKALSDNNYLDVAQKIAWAFKYADDYLFGRSTSMLPSKSRREWIKDYLESNGIFITTRYLGALEDSYKSIHIELKTTETKK